MLEEIILASPHGFCAGVVMAIATVNKALKKHGVTYVRHQIVHNKTVIEDLTGRGAKFVDTIEEVPSGSPLIYSAHGVPPSVRREAEQRGLMTIDATCPLVTKVHQEVRRYAEGGYSVILIGHKEHVEVQGTFGEAPYATQIIGSVEEAKNVQIPNPEKVAYATQTTLSVDETRDIITTLKERFPSIKEPQMQDICYATQNRQDAVKKLAALTQLVLVIGSKNSSNSNSLANVAREAGTAAHLIDSHHDIQKEWLGKVNKLGITAGVSAPEYLVQDTIRYLTELYPMAQVVTLNTVHETERHFKLPKGL